MVKTYIFNHFDDFFAIFSVNNNASKLLYIPKRMINVPLEKGNLVEIIKIERGYKLSVLEE